MNLEKMYAIRLIHASSPMTVFLEDGSYYTDGRANNAIVINRKHNLLHHFSISNVPRYQASKRPVEVTSIRMNTITSIRSHLSMEEFEDALNMIKDENDGDIDAEGIQKILEDINLDFKK